MAINRDPNDPNDPINVERAGYIRTIAILVVIIIAMFIIIIFYYHNYLRTPTLVVTPNQPGTTIAPTNLAPVTPTRSTY